MTGELAELFRRDLTRLAQELRAFPDDATLWKTLPGIRNSAGNLTLHLEGNLREYIGRQLGGVPYQRERDKEFGLTGFSIAELAQRIESLQRSVPGIIEALTQAQLDATYPEAELGITRRFVLSLYGHFSYHLGQIDYLRRVLTSGSAVQFVQQGS